MEKNVSAMSVRTFYNIGAWAALLHFVSMVAIILVEILLGPKPATAEEFFLIQQNSYLEALLRGDFLLVFLVGAYLGTFPALFMALKNINWVAAFFATLFTTIAVVMTFANESTFALLHLGEQFALADNETLRIQLLAAGEAVIAADMWNSTGGYMSGFLAQGSGVIISLVMLKSKNFGKITAIAGLAGNAMDLIQHSFYPFMTEFAKAIHPIMGVFYAVWFIMLARDLFRLTKKTKFNR